MSMNGFGMRPGIIVLREGTDTSQGTPQLISNINACQAVADAVRTTLGPAGRDKLVATSGSGGATISNDGATIMKLLEIEHPAARTLVDISASQDSRVGDGTTTVVLLAGEILSQIKSFVEDGVHPQILMKNVRLAGRLAVQKVRDMSVSFDEDDGGCDDEKRRDMLIKTAGTALNSKLISNHKDMFAPMIVDAVLSLHEASKKKKQKEESDNDGRGGRHNRRGGRSLLDDASNLIAIKRIPGGDVRQSFLVRDGVAFRKTFSYAGFDQMKKRFENPRILLLNVELELKSERENAEVRVSDPDEYQSVVDAEWDVIYGKLNACVQCGADVVLSKLPVGDLATQYFADRGLFCAGRVADSDLRRVAKATGAVVQTTTNGLVRDDRDDKNAAAVADGILGTCGLFEERRVGDERFNVFTRCADGTDGDNARGTTTSTIVLRGGTEQFIAESERSVRDAIMVVKRSIQSGGKIVAGGGAVEMELSRYLRDRALLTIPGKGQLVVRAYARAMEIVPRQLCDNAGYESTDILAALRRKHAASSENDDEDGRWYGVDLTNGGICDTFERGIWEPADNKINALEAATEAACLILSIDETVVAPRSQDPGAAATGMMGGGGGGGGENAMPMTNMMGNAMATAAQTGGGGARSGQLAPGVSYMKGRGGG